jgi:hypothetical protein
VRGERRAPIKQCPRPLAVPLSPGGRGPSERSEAGVRGERRAPIKQCPPPPVMQKSERTPITPSYSAKATRGKPESPIDVLREYSPRVHSGDDAIPGAHPHHRSRWFPAKPQASAHRPQTISKMHRWSPVSSLAPTGQRSLAGSRGRSRTPPDQHPIRSAS